MTLIYGYLRQLEGSINSVAAQVNRITGSDLQPIKIEYPESTGSPAKASKRTTWTVQEHCKFIQCVLRFGRNNIKQIAEAMAPGRTADQVRSHAQKYFSKIDKCNRKALTATNQMYESVLQPIQTNLDAALRELAQRGLNDPAVGLEYQFFTFFGKNVFREAKQENGMISSWNPRDEQKIFTVTRPLFQYDLSEKNSNIYIPLSAFSRAFAKLRQTFAKENIILGGAAIPDESATNPYDLISAAVAGRFHLGKSQAICFVQCVYTNSFDLQVQSTAPTEKMNTTLIIDPGNKNEPQFL